MPGTSGPTAADAGTVDIGGDITVNRLGFGAMRIGPHLEESVAAAGLRLDRQEIAALNDLG